MAQNRTQPETSFSNDHESGGIQDRGSERESNKQDEIISDDKMHQKKICSFYRKGNCKHGLRGNGCNYHHPPMCKKFINHGTRNPKGCNLGKNCENFHPKICSSSLTKSECFTHDCKFRHIKGTKRKKSQEPRKPNGNSDSKKENHNNEHNDAHFLDVIRCLKEEIIQQMETRIASISNQIQLNNQTRLITPQQPIIPPSYQKQNQMTQPPYTNQQAMYTIHQLFKINSNQSIKLISLQHSHKTSFVKFE